MEQTVRLIDTDSVLRRYGSGKGLFRDEIGFVRCMKMLCLTCDVGVTLLSMYLLSSVFAHIGHILGKKQIIMTEM